MNCLLGKFVKEVLVHCWYVSWLQEIPRCVQTPKHSQFDVMLVSFLLFCLNSSNLSRHDSLSIMLSTVSVLHGNKVSPIKNHCFYVAHWVNISVVLYICTLFLFSFVAVYSLWHHGYKLVKDSCSIPYYEAGDGSIRFPIPQHIVYRGHFFSFAN